MVNEWESQLHDSTNESQFTWDSFYSIWFLDEVDPRGNNHIFYAVALARSGIAHASNLKKEMTKILFDQGYILSYKFDDTTSQGVIKIALKYTKDTKESVIKKIQRISKPGLRKYASSKELPRILNGLGIAIVSTSRGVMTGKQAQRENVGGEVLCYVY